MFMKKVLYKKGHYTKILYKKIIIKKSGVKKIFKKMLPILWVTNNNKIKAILLKMFNKICH